MIRPVADPVVDRLELLVDEHRHEVAPPDLAVQDLPHRLERRVREARQLHEVEEQEVDVLERLSEQGERRLGGGVPHELLDVGVEAFLEGQAGLDVPVEAGEVDPLLGQDRVEEVNDPHERVVDQPKLLRPVPKRQGPGLAVGQGLGADPEEALEAAEPHLELEELAGLPRLRDLVGPAPQLPPHEVRARLGRGPDAVVSRLPAQRADYRLGRPLSLTDRPSAVYHGRLLSGGASVT
jgi:hypothetical protein